MGKPPNPDTTFVVGSTTAGGSVITPVWCEPSTVDVVLNQASAAQTANGNTANLSVSQYHELAVGVNITAVTGTSPSMTLNVDTLGADGIWYTIYTSSAQTAAGAVVTSIGAGLATNQSFGQTIRLRWTITGTTPSFTFSASILGKQAI